MAASDHKPFRFLHDGDRQFEVLSTDPAVFGVQIAKHSLVSPIPERDEQQCSYDIETRHLRAVTVLAEELNFTRAAHKLNISQPALSKWITDLEERYGFQLFTRSNKRDVQLTDAGRVFVEGARSALTNIELTARRARAAHEGNSSALIVGFSLMPMRPGLKPLVPFISQCFPSST
jgi:predicted transcriptional regulator